MADHLMLAEGYRLVQRPPPAAPAHGPHALRTLQPYASPGLDSGLRPRGAPLGPPPPPTRSPGVRGLRAAVLLPALSGGAAAGRRQRAPAACGDVVPGPRGRAPRPRRRPPRPAAGARRRRRGPAARARPGRHGRRTHRRGGADVAGARARAAPRARAARALPGPERVRLLLGLGVGAARRLGELL
ncbi:cbp/p300-interacting transactivator 4, partial [Daubentonia madagascariensis]